ncbi:MAG: hypothetical protein PHH14_06360, partial [Candidatus Margulisbacteria bacterium]|nr:hypothetical protein [Candidatus Margulisiibacteriota bacterium]
MSINKAVPFDIFKAGCPFTHYVKVPALLKENPVWGNPDGLKKFLPFAAELKKERAWAEAWLLSALSGEKESNRVKINGQAGTISGFFAQGFFSAGFTAANFSHASFPFLVKIISAERPLSIHVHPSGKNFPRTKSEYFLALEPSQIITGFVSGRSKNQFIRLLNSGGLNMVTGPEHQLIKDLFIIDTLNPGDILTVANTPHALLK